MNRPVRIGTRGSALALWQADRVRGALAVRGVAAEVVEIRTTGDGIQDRPLASIGDTALFTRQLDDALLEGRIDLAVHSLKDLPSRLRAGIDLGAVSAREDPRDALVTRDGRGWADLPGGATIATCSVRRRAQLLWQRPDLTVDAIRGNVDTRLAKLDRTPAWAATLLAAAGLVRLGLGSRISERLDPAIMLPAPGQGALGVTIRTDDDRVRAAVRGAIHDPETAACVAAERALLGALDGGCQVPIAALGTIDDGILRFEARILSLDGREALEEAARTPLPDDPDPAESAGRDLGERVAAALKGRGAVTLLAGAPPPLARGADR